MARLQIQVVVATMMMLSAACAKRQHPTAAAPTAPPAPAPKPVPAQNIFALLPDPQGNATAIVVTNSGGTQEIHEANHAVRVEREDAAPTPPFSVDQPTVRRMFGAALDAMPDPEIHFLLYFDEASDTLSSEAQATMASIVQAVQERHSTDISVTGHTDRTGSTEENYRLGLRRAERVAIVLRGRGLEDSSLFVTSHGESDPLIKTGPGVPEQRNRRVEVIVH
jgi:outer membrane protein OmpA-like peptidoglycan-associated protein